MKSSPPKMALQRICRNVTRFAYANPVPVRQAAEFGCWTGKRTHADLRRVTCFEKWS
jgi:hypothetical protein